MRLRNLFEYSSIEQAKSDVINTINGLDPSDEKGAELIDRIFRALNSEETGGKIEKAFGPQWQTKECQTMLSYSTLLKLLRLYLQWTVILQE